MAHGTDRVTGPVPLNRRGFVKVLGLAGAAAACAPAAAPAVAPAATAAGQPAAAGGKPAWEKDWENLVAAAKQEGKLALRFTGAGAGFQQLGQAFEQAFPGITVDVTAYASGGLWVGRAVQEWNAGVYTWDAAVDPYDYVKTTLQPLGIPAPVRPALFHPDALKDEAWLDGFEAGFIDNGKQISYSGRWEKLGALWINSDLVKENEIRTAADLLDPKWKGKLVFATPSTYGGTYHPATSMRLRMGDTVLKKLFVDQEPAISKDNRQITEWLVRGRYVAGWGVTPPILADFLSQGTGKSLKTIDLPEAVTPVVNGIYLLNKATHPNAAKLFANWFLTQEGQRQYAALVKTNTRRKGIDQPNPSLVVPPGKYPHIAGTEAALDNSVKTQEMLKELGV